MLQKPYQLQVVYIHGKPSTANKHLWYNKEHLVGIMDTKNKPFHYVPKPSLTHGVKTSKLLCSVCVCVCVCVVCVCVVCV